jgi:hypothetical protein
MYWARQARFRGQSNTYDRNEHCMLACWHADMHKHRCLSQIQLS